jgi:hypothetical protein
MSNAERAKLLRRPWGLADVMREKKAAEKRRAMVEKERKKWREKRKSTT